MKDKLYDDMAYFGGHAFLRPGNKRMSLECDVRQLKTALTDEHPLIEPDSFDRYIKADLTGLRTVATENLAYGKEITKKDAKQQVDNLLVDEGYASYKQNRPTLVVKGDDGG